VTITTSKFFNIRLLKSPREATVHILIFMLIINYM